ncbi:MAG: hypothetical protein HZA37_01035 [Parcubacteria group bacterium]|nr:hypothetical protein [Parcubacteria group bacterium]
MPIKNKIKKIIFATHDAGGADTLVPVIKRIAKNKLFSVKVLFSGPARLIAKKNKIKFIGVNGYTTDKIEKSVSFFGPDFILTGTSSGMHIDKALWRAAKKLGIPTAAILDSWVNYGRQFSFSGRRGVVQGKLPDHILIMDKTTRREMIAEGFPKERLIVTGNPHFDGFKKFKNIGFKSAKKILFIDQHFSELVASGVHENLGFAEIKVFGDLVNALEKLNWTGELLIKFHPGSKSLSRFDEIIAGSGLRIRKAKRGDDIRALIERNDLIFGMTSMALFEAALGGKIVCSYQPGLARKTDALISNRLGLSYHTRRASELPGLLKKLIGPSANLRVRNVGIRNYFHRNATQNVIDFMTAKHKHKQ